MEVGRIGSCVKAIGNGQNGNDLLAAGGGVVNMLGAKLLRRKQEGKNVSRLLGGG